MFSGIIEATGTVRSARARGACRAVRIGKPRGWKLSLGQSISIDGICSTVVKRDAKSFEVEYMPETLGKTTASRFVPGALLNLERSLTLHQYIDGHLVMGHVDAVATIARIEAQQNASLITIAIPASLAPLTALHGSVAVNGVSLTIARKKGNTVTVSLIPHTLTATNLGAVRKGTHVNLEIDMMARYVFAALTKPGTMRSHAKKSSRKK